MTSPDAKPMLLTEEEARLRAEVYLQQRLDYQDLFYKSRMREFTFNADVMLLVTAGLMGLSTILSSYSVVSDQPFYAFLTALLPAFAAAISAFRALYQWQRQASLYEDSWLSLQKARLAMPDSDFMQSGDYQRFFPQLVRQTEGVLRNEASQWGQLQNVVTEEAAPEPSPDGSSPA